MHLGPVELAVLLVLALAVLGPNKLPGLAKDAARVLKSLRSAATSARSEIREELGPDFAEVDLRSLHPRRIVSDVILAPPNKPSTPPSADDVTNAE